MSQLRRVAAAAALLCAMPFASAAVLTFNDLPAGTAFFTSNYQGFQFGTNAAATNAFFYSNAATVNYMPFGGTGNFVAVDYQIYDNNNPYQGTTAASLSGPQQLITNTTPFRFDGAYFSGSDSIGFKLYVGNTVVFTTVTPTPVTPGTTALVPSGYAGFVTGVEIFGRQGFYAMDNFTYTLVPEPQTYALMAAGLLAVGGLARRRSGSRAG